MQYMQKSIRPGSTGSQPSLSRNSSRRLLPGLMDFCLYCIYNSVIDHELYSRNGKTAAI